MVVIAAGAKVAQIGATQAIAGGSVKIGVSRAGLKVLGAKLGTTATTAATAAAGRFAPGLAVGTAAGQVPGGPGRGARMATIGRAGGRGEKLSSKVIGTRYPKSVTSALLSMPAKDMQALIRAAVSARLGG